VPDSASAIRKNAATLRSNGDYARAVEVLSALRDRQTQELGPAHPELACTLGDLALIAFTRKNGPEAESLIQTAIDIYRKALGPFNLSLAQHMMDFASAAEDASDYRFAETLLREALGICSAATPENHPQYAKALHRLASLLLLRGSLQEAESLFRNALRIQRACLGPEDRALADTLNGLAEALRLSGRDREAEPLYLKALDILKPSQSPDFVRATVLNNLGLLYKNTARFREAEHKYREAIEIFSKEPGSRELGMSVSNLATLYDDLRDAASAERLYLDALEILKAAVGTQHPDFAIVANNLGELFRQTHRYTAAEKMLSDAVKIRRDCLGRHPFLATSLQNLALLYSHTGRLAESAALCKEAISIRETTISRPSDLAKAFSTLAVTRTLQGSYGEAAYLFERAIQFSETALGPVHPELSHLLSNLAWIRAALNRPDDALSLMKRVTEIDNSTLSVISAFGADETRVAFLSRILIHLEQSLALTWRSFPNSPDAVQFAFRQVLIRKAIAAEALAVRRDAILSNRNPNMRQQLDQLVEVTERIGRLVIAGPQHPSSEAYLRLLNSLQADKERLERDLATQIPELSLQKQLGEAGVTEVAAALPTGTVLIEFIRFEPISFEQLDISPAQYFAFVLPARQPTRLQLIHLGDALSIDTLVHELRNRVTRTGEAWFGRFRRPTLRGPGAELKRLLLGPLQAALGDARRLMIAPDGDLHLLPFEILPFQQNKLVIQHFDVIYLPSGRDVIRAEFPSPPSSPPVVIAAPDFDFGGETRKTKTGKRDPTVPAFPPLPGTLREGSKVAATLGVAPWLGSAALESRVKLLRSPQILHMATHGFFLPGHTWARLSEPAPGSGSSTIADFLGATAIIGNPLLRSGLALAGANARAYGFQPGPEAEDGLLTALDVTGIDLSGTRLVVLSACVTGLGELHPAEGVMGLRRSFAVAGAAALVVSLWNVPDHSTASLMQKFYQRLSQGFTPSAALHDAQGQVKRWYRNPYFWGAFVCQGNAWQPIAWPGASSHAQIRK